MYTSIGRLSTDGEDVLSMVDGHLTLTYEGGDDCGSGRKRKTIITLLCDKDALVILNFDTLCVLLTGFFKRSGRNMCDKYGL